ncbi:MAG TPA: PTS glucose transporter subunit IIA [Egibacteraceae bacterium]|nr:PTS glucose transporter subunit IIA [Egibacteraceae bacterium]
MTVVASPLAGRVIALDDVADPVFAGRIMGDGVALAPSDGRLAAPVAGRIEKLFPGGHGVAIETPDGLQVLVHLGLETVQLHGDGFTVHAAEGQDVQVGDLLVTADLDRLHDLGVDVTSPVVVISGQSLTVVGTGEVQIGDPLLEVALQES